MILTPRWTTLREAPGPARYAQSRARFNVVPAGRRSYKTETAKRKLVRATIRGTNHYPSRFFAAAPTRDQAMRIFWDDFKLMFPEQLVINISERGVITTVTRSELHVLGMDRPERIEGSPWDGGVLDEYANMKASTWGANVRPALADRDGWCDLIGVPEGRNHFYDRYEYACNSGDPEWAGIWWKSSEVLDEAEIESAKRETDELTFQQEYEASFVNFLGRAYHAFNEAEHCRRLEYDPQGDLIFCFDFNVSPGVAVVAQEQDLPEPSNEHGTGIIGEVHIPKHSTTAMVCRRLSRDWAKHEGRILLYGDATGGLPTSRDDRSGSNDWDIVMQELRREDTEVGKPDWSNRLINRVRRSNPRVRSRINAVNSRLKTTTGRIRCLLDPSKAPMTKRDFEGVRLLEGSGELDKKSDPALTHLTDGFGYYVADEFPVSQHTTVVSSF